MTKEEDHCPATNNSSRADEDLASGQQSEGVAAPIKETESLLATEQVKTEEGEVTTPSAPVQKKDEEGKEEGCTAVPCEQEQSEKTKTEHTEENDVAPTSTRLEPAGGGLSANKKNATMVENLPDGEEPPPESAPDDANAPGAYARSGRVPFLGLTLPPQSNSSTQAPLTSASESSEQQDDGMVQATEVKDLDLMERAEPVHHDHVDAVKEKPKHHVELKHKVFALLLVTIIPCAAIALVVGLLVGRTNTSTAPTIAPAPSPSPSDFPSYTPTYAPTGILDTLVLTLPDYTQESLKDPLSVQSMAYDWLSRHQNLTNLEHWRKTQLFAIATFFYSMEGPNWPQTIQDAWLDDTKHECDWFSNGYGYLREDGSYVEVGYAGHYPCNNRTEYETLFLNNLDLASSGRPVLPPEITLLTSLRNIWLVHDSIHLPLDEFLPPQIYGMSSLANLLLHANALSGTIPTRLQEMPSLAWLSLYGNSVTGTIPTEIGLFSKIERLYLEDNLLTGTIPTEIMLAPKLFNVVLNRNPLTVGATIPSEIGLLTSLSSLHLEGCSLAGSLPTEMSVLPDLAFVNLEDNTLSGSIPSQFGALSILRGLKVGNNQMTGSLPTELGLMTSFSRLHLNDNLFEGPLPSELGLLEALEVVYIQDNAWTGSIPSQVGLLWNMKELNLSRSELTGTIPEEMSVLATDFNLTYFHVGETDLSGSIPEDLCLLRDNPECVYYASWIDMMYGISQPCTLEFDCGVRNGGDGLCGCDCPCADNNATATSSWDASSNATLNVTGATLSKPALTLANYHGGNHLL